MSYALEVWSVVGHTKAALDALKSIEVQFLRSMLGVPHTVSTKLVYAEFGRLPIYHFWLQQSLKFCDRFVQMDDTHLHSYLT